MISENDFINGISNGLFDASIPSSSRFKPALVCNSARRRVLSTILDGLEFSNSYFIAVAFATKSGVASIINRLIELDRNGANGKILVSQYLNFTQPEALRAIRQFKSIELRMATSGSFHAKAYFFERTDGHCDLVIGSSNLTASALSTNREWNVRIANRRESQLYIDIKQQFEQEFLRSVIVDDAFLNKYHHTYSLAQLERFHPSENDVNALNVESIRPNQTVPIPDRNLGNLLPISADAGNSSSETISTHREKISASHEITPNLMQSEALLALNGLRLAGKSKALIHWRPA